MKKFLLVGGICVALLGAAPAEAHLRAVRSGDSINLNCAPTSITIRDALDEKVPLISSEPINSTGDVENTYKLRQHSAIVRIERYFGQVYNTGIGRLAVFWHCH